MRRAAVIGAGAAGLSAAKHLKEAGIAVTIFELGSRIGGLWVYENDNGLSPAYASLHLNSENKVTAYRDFPFPPDAPLYPDHAAVARYLENYADRFGLRDLIRFRSRVTSVERAAEGRWTVRMDGSPEECFDVVVVASGHQGVPKHPAFAQDFAGEYLHAHSYRTPEPFRGKHVLVVGVGNSACDIAADICSVTASTTMVARSPVLFMPRMFLGVPTSRVLGRIEKRWMPWPLRRRIRELISRIAHGRMEQWGFVTPKKRTHPAGHHLLMAQFIWGKVTAKPAVRAVSGHEVSFVDGTSRHVDTIIAATGYEIDLPFLSEDLSPVRGHWLDLYRRVVRPNCPGLYFVGFFNVTGGGNIRMMDDQAEWVAALATGAVGLPHPAAMEADILAERRRIQELYPDSPRYGLELDPAEYRAALRAERRRASRASAAPARS
jgi:dimethylaniline monooxygenase (N-oxide forming)